MYISMENISSFLLDNIFTLLIEVTMNITSHNVSYNFQPVKISIPVLFFCLIFDLKFEFAADSIIDMPS